LKGQAQGATRGHAQAFNQLTDQQATEIVNFELSLFTAQDEDNAAGNLQAQGGRGGPHPALSNQEFYLGINDPLGGNPTGAPFNPKAFNIYDAWANLPSAQTAPYTAPRQAIARGQALFNSKPIQITGVAGLNDKLGQPTIMGTCTMCHDTPNVGNHSVSAPLNIGLTDASQRTPDFPLYRLQCTSGRVADTTDPGRALITGKCEDIGKFKGPILRGLPARAPYFHNGSAATVEDVINFYDRRFDIRFTPAEKADLAAFLRAN
jgi:hypothetical protein